jgi:putative Ca2+/H+ antiporter (TMEM165/GDT1 family)
MIPFWQALGLVGLAEMGDKTQLVTLGFACRYRPRTVFLAVALAIIILQAIAVSIGGLISRFLPEQWLGVVSGVAFLLFGAWTIWEGVPEEPETNVDAKASGRGPFFTVLSTFLISELADKSTLATAAIASETRSYAWVWLGGTLGMIAADGLAIWVGAVAGKQLPRRAIHYAGAAVFILSGLITLARLWLT